MLPAQTLRQTRSRESSVGRASLNHGAALLRRHHSAHGAHPDCVGRVCTLFGCDADAPLLSFCAATPPWPLSSVGLLSYVLGCIGSLLNAGCNRWLYTIWEMKRMVSKLFTDRLFFPLSSTLLYIDLLARSFLLPFRCPQTLSFYFFLVTLFISSSIRVLDRIPGFLRFFFFFFLTRSNSSSSFLSGHSM